ncbi:MAG: prolyl oligopeptidase family serine peptidase [Planctomycetaceae bacterium]|nr:prolyl oligopeptidase family serine peptidase [Planctomycetaceae bacterium]
MLRIILSLLLVNTAMVFSRASAADAWKDLFETKTYRSDKGRSIPYRLMRPAKVEPGKKYPLVLFLHGAGERGVDNARQLTHGVGGFATAEMRREHPCFVVAPQCPTDRRWVEVDWALPAHKMPKEISEPLGLALELLDKLLVELPVDRDRVYVTGLSMGGFGTWDVLSRRPEQFAAGVPVCGGGDVGQAEKLKRIPIWAFHGDQDRTVLVSRTKDMVNSIRKIGGVAKMTIYPGVDHDSWIATYADPKVMAWLFEQRKASRDSGRPQ